MTRSADEQGAGLVSLPWGVLAFLMFLMLSVQVAVHLFSVSIVTAVGHDATRRAMLDGAGPAAIAEAERWLRSRLGPALDIESLRWTTTNDFVALDVAARPPNVLLSATSLIGMRTIERRFEMRREIPRFAGT